ncbi:MAG TPA: hypothetical protein VGK10_05420 [Prolixibacteraceae bacterium]|jgi:hypothetical protein
MHELCTSYVQTKDLVAGRYNLRIGWIIEIQVSLREKIFNWRNQISAKVQENKNANYSF